MSKAYIELGDRTMVERTIQKLGEPRSVVEAEQPDTSKLPTFFFFDSAKQQLVINGQLLGGPPGSGLGISTKELRESRRRPATRAELEALKAQGVEIDPNVPAVVDEPGWIADDNELRRLLPRPDQGAGLVTGAQAIAAMGSMRAPRPRSRR